MKPRADWLGWVLQFGAGLVIGALIGSAIASGRRGGGLIKSEHAGLFVLGTALLGAGLASYLGDRLWLHNYSATLPPDAPEHSRVSRAASWVVGGVGAALALFAALRSFGVIG